MLNALRLTEGFKKSWFEDRTFLSLNNIQLQSQLQALIEKGLLEDKNTVLKPSELGQRFLNEITVHFL
jgi:oxygen-independent coproporphyrinogen-3 oxidase